jgi:hypothetical protein
MASLRETLTSAGKDIKKQWSRTKTLAKGAVSAVDEALVPGEGKASNIGRDAKKLYRTMRGTKPPLTKRGNPNG